MVVEGCHLKLCAGMVFPSALVSRGYLRIYPKLIVPGGLSEGIDYRSRQRFDY